MSRNVIAVVAALWLTLLAAPSADAVDVLVFNSTRYVDSHQGAAYPVGSQESDNVQAALAALGHAVSTIAGPDDPVGTCGPGVSQPGTVLATAAEYGAALAANAVFVIPEQESWCYLPGDLLNNHPDIAAAWRTWVAGGGGLVIHSSKEAKQKVDDLFSVVFGFRAGPPVDGVDGALMHKTPAAASTQFAAGPAAITVNPSTGLLPLAGLPPGAVSVYDDGTNAAVAIIPFGSGRIVFLGWDWTKSNPPFTTDGQNGGWFPAVMDGAVHAAAGTPAPPTHLLTVAKAGTGAGTVVSSPAGIDCGTDCAHAYPAGTAVTLSAAPAAGSAFAGWSGGGCGGTGPCAVTLSADVVVTATFTAPAPPPVVTLQVTARPGTVHPGTMLEVDLAVANPGPARVVDVYFGVLLPPGAGPGFGCPRGDALAFMADGFSRVVVACASSPIAGFPPLFRGATVPGGTSATEVPDFWSAVWQAGLPAGTYTVFAALTPAGALADGRLDAGDLLAVATSGVVTAP